MNGRLDAPERDGGVALSVRLPGDANAPRAARHAMAGLAHALEAETLERLQLLVSELVTNSYRHSGDRASVEVRVTLTPTCVRAEVVDSGAGFAVPLASPRGALRASGWGLFLTDRLASRWGVAGGGGTSVWFEIDVRAEG